jgi:hypothetical protein
MAQGNQQRQTGPFTGLFVRLGRQHLVHGRLTDREVAPLAGEGGPARGITMNLHRHVFREVRDIIERNGSLPPLYWFEFSSDTYPTTQASACSRSTRAF